MKLNTDNVVTMRTIAINILFLIFPLLLFCQDENYVVRTYTTENGLVNNNVRSIARDGYGFLWISTWDGLSRYDGKEFRNYHHDPDDSTSLPYFELRKVTVDPNNNVWIESQYLSKYDRANDNFINYSLGCSNEQNFMELNLVQVVDAENIWYLCGDRRISKYNSVLDSTIEYHYDRLKTAEGRFEVNRDRFYFFDWQKVREYYIDDAQDSLIFIKDYLFPESSGERKLIQGNYRHTIDIIKSNRDEIFFQFPNETLLFDRNTGNQVHFDPYEIDWLNLQDIGMGWISGMDGLIIKPNTNIKSSLIPKMITGYPQACLYDQGGVYWMGGYSLNEQGYGLKAIIPVPSIFKHYLKNYDSGEKAAVFACYKDHTDQVWIGIKGLNYLIKLKQNGAVEHCNFISNEEVIKSRQPRAFYELGDSILLIGYYRELFMKYDYTSGLFEPMPRLIFDETRKMTPFSTKLLAQYDENHILIGSDTIISKLNIKTNRVINTYIISKLAAMSMHVDIDGTVWIGYQLGFLHHLDSNLRLIEKFIVGNSNLESICREDDGILWIASLGDGLFRFDTKTNTWNSYNTGDGLVNNVLYNILKDKHGNLWMSSDHGISMFNPREETFRNFGLSDGLLIDEFNADAAYLAPDGEMIFGGVGGIVRFYPDSIIDRNEDYKPHLLITDMFVSGTERHFGKAVYEMDKLTLSKGDNNFRLFFNANDLKNADKIRYRYRLQPVDKNWIETNHRNRSVSYAGLSPGNYHFYIEATNPNGDWDLKTSLVIRIPAWFYQTLWFKMAVFLVISLILFFFFMQWLRQNRLQNRQLQQSLRLESLRGQLNPHFIYNSLNSINYFISKSDRENANQYIADFARLMRAILNNSTAEFIPLKKEIEAISDYLKLEYMRFEDKFNFEILINPDLEVENLEVAPTILQPFIENAIWHGVRYLEDRKGFIHVRFEEFTGKFIRCYVEDDGIGRKLSAERKSPDQKKRTSKGIKIIMERISLMNMLNKTNCSIVIEDLYSGNPETGTKVVVELPARIEPSKFSD